MRLQNLIIAALLSFPTPLFAADGFLGTWVGDVQEEGQDQPYPMTLKLFEHGGRIFQNTRYGAPLDCDAGGLLIERGTGMLYLSEFITRNRAQCADGSIRLYLNGEKALIWEWFNWEGTYLARAELTLTK